MLYLSWSKYDFVESLHGGETLLPEISLSKDFLDYIRCFKPSIRLFCQCVPFAIFSKREYAEALLIFDFESIQV